MRVRIAASAAPSVMAGRMRCDDAAAAGDRQPAEEHGENTRMSTGPSAKFGTERPSNVNKPTAWSAGCHDAARRAGPREFQSRSKRGAQRRRVRAWRDNAKDDGARVAESETIRRDCHERLRRGSGRTARERERKPESVAKLLQSSARAPSPSICCTGSPGTICASRKTMVTMSHSAGRRIEGAAKCSAIISSAAAPSDWQSRTRDFRLRRRCAFGDELRRFRLAMRDAASGSSAERLIFTRETRRRSISITVNR